jgi:hypothetical protein
MNGGERVSGGGNGCALKCARPGDLAERRPRIDPDREIDVKRLALLFSRRGENVALLEGELRGPEEVPPDGRCKVYTIDERILGKGDFFMQCRDYTDVEYPVIRVTPEHLENLPDKDNKLAVLTGNRIAKGRVINPKDVLSRELRGSNFFILVDPGTFTALKMTPSDMYHVKLQREGGDGVEGQFEAEPMIAPEAYWEAANRHICITC